MNGPFIYDAYGKEIKPGDTILYPLVVADEYPPHATILELVVFSVDTWIWTKEWCDKFGFVYDPDLPPGFVVTAVDAVDYVTRSDPDDMYRFRILDPSTAVVVTGQDLTKRAALPPPDRRGFWSRPGRH